MYSLIKYNKSLSFYRSITNNGSFDWAARNYLDPDLMTERDAIATFLSVNSFVEDFKFVRFMLVTCAMCGFISGIVIALIGLTNKALTLGVPWGLMLTSLGMITVGLAYAIYWLFDALVPASNELLDAWIEVNWTTADFEDSLRQIGCLRQTDDLPALPFWMSPTGVESINSTVPYHVVRVCTDHIHTRIEDIIQGRFDPDQGKTYVKEFLVTCQRLQIFPVTEDIRDYYREVKARLEAAKA